MAIFLTGKGFPTPRCLAAVSFQGSSRCLEFWRAGQLAEAFCLISDCVEGPTLVDLPHHALGENPDAVIRQVKIVNAWWPNQDGIRGGTNSLIENCFLKCCDDNFYAGFNVRRCVLWPSWNGAIIQLGWGGYNSGGTRMTDTDLINPEWDYPSANDGFLDATAMDWSARSDSHLL